MFRRPANFTHDTSSHITFFYPKDRDHQTVVTIVIYNHVVCADYRWKKKANTSAQESHIMSFRDSS